MCLILCLNACYMIKYEYNVVLHSSIFPNRGVDGRGMLQIGIRALQ
jgi:hypothetical protein